MPTRNLYVRGSNGCLELITPRGLPDSDGNVFDKAFTTAESAEIEWKDWMRWEGGGIEGPIFDRKQSGSAISSQDNWCSDAEAPFMTDNDLSFDDAPFELDETARPSLGLPFGAGGEAIPSAFEASRERSQGRYSSLTQAEEQTLQNIAMPYLLSKVKISSEPASPTTSHSSHSSHSFSPEPEPEPETPTRKNKKRKSVNEDDDVPTALCMSRKRGHNAIEKRYRTNLNDKINCLRQGVPSLCRTDSGLGDEEEDDDDAEGVDSKTGQQKYGKAAILTRALEYIQHLEMTTERLGSEVTILKTRVGAFEKLAMSGSIIINGGGAARLSEPIIKSETLQSIQADFKSIKPHASPTKPISPRRRSSKNPRGC